MNPGTPKPDDEPLMPFCSRDGCYARRWSPTDHLCSTHARAAQSAVTDERAANERTFQMFAAQGQHPAPHREPRCCMHHYASEMTKREAMAIAALAGLLGCRELGNKSAARLAVEIADALLEELAK